MWPTYFHNADVTLLKTYELPVIRKAFESIANRFEIEFNFPQGGCQQRAHIMSMILSKKFNIDHCKAWLFSPAALDMCDTTTLYIEDENGLSPGNKIEWNYHVVPVVQVTTANGGDTYVIDPSTNRDEPVHIAQWFLSIGNSSKGKYTFLLPDKYFFNCFYIDNNLTNIFDGSFMDFDNPVKDELILEKGLALNDMAMKIYHTYIQPLICSDGPGDETRFEDLKAVFGNATVLDLLFAQHISGNTNNTTHRYVITHYGDIVKEAKTIFTERLLFWTNFTNSLLAA